MLYLILDSGLIIQPFEKLMNITNQEKQCILDLLSFSLNETIHKNKNCNQIKIYEFIYDLHKHLKNSSLDSMGLYLSDDFVKTQLVIAMAHGVTMKLCKEKYVDFADKVIQDLFHVNLLQE